MEFRRASLEISDARLRHAPLPGDDLLINIHDLECTVSVGAIRAS